MIKVTIVIGIFLVGVLFSTALVGACGWFTYEDIEDTRSYYNAYDELTGVEDGLLLVSRYPMSIETKKNVYMPMEENLNG